ncbi:hypothetical protein N9S14_01565 [Candidatus Pelagibacter sp.]|nr:hypothetical protein [Candidatus Pelagibacter sp.]
MSCLYFFFKKNFLNLILSLLVLLLFTHYVYQANKFSNLNNAWLIGDWLINYEGGFVRRGLSGEFFLLLNSFLNVELNRLIFYFQFLISLIFFSLCYFYFTKIKLDIFLVCLIFSPTILMFSFYDAFMVSRKEFLIYITFLSLIFIIKNNIKNQIIISLYLIFSSVILPLITEIVFFYLPYFYLLIRISKNNDNKFFSRIVISQLIITSLLILFISFFGSQLNTDEICKIIIENNGNSNLCLGAISDNRQILEIISYNLSRYNNYNYFLNYFLSFFITCFLISIYLYLLNLKNLIVRFNIYIIFLFVFSTPLFILGTDWGRWINIHFILIIFLLIYLKINNYKNIKEVNIFLNKRNYLIFLIFLFFSFSWNTWNCCPKLSSSSIFNFGGGIYERMNTLKYKFNN